jgi:hypothetical protein
VKHQTTGEEKMINQKDESIALIQMLTIKSLNKKDESIALIQMLTIKSLNNKTTKWQESTHTYQY